MSSRINRTDRILITNQMILVGKALPLNMDDRLTCVNHPSTETLVRCGSCDKPICVRCMRESPVGMKCRDCARLPRRAITIGKPRNYMIAAGVSASAAAVLGALLTFFSIPFFGFILPLLTGFAIGSMVRRFSGGLGHGPIQAVTALGTAVGLTVGRLAVGMPLIFQIRGSLLLATLLATMSAAITVGR